MKVKKFRFYLEDIRDEGYGSYVMNFSDQNEDYYTVNTVSYDSEGKLCLQSSKGHEMTANELLESLSDVDDNTYVYFKHLYWDDTQLICDIEGGWYIDDNNDLVMDVTYEDDDDDKKTKATSLPER